MWNLTSAKSTQGFPVGQGFGREASRSHRLREAVPATVDQEQASHREERERRGRTPTQDRAFQQAGFRCRALEAWRRWDLFLFRRTRESVMGRIVSSLGQAKLIGLGHAEWRRDSRYKKKCTVNKIRCNYTQSETYQAPSFPDNFHHIALAIYQLPGGPIILPLSLQPLIKATPIT